MTDLCWSWTCSPACSWAWRSLWHSAGWSASTPRLIICTSNLSVFLSFCCVLSFNWPILALHLITSTPDTAWDSLTRRVILLNDQMFSLFSDILLLSWQLLLPRVWPVRGLQQSVTLPEYLEIPQRVILHSVTIHVELESRRGVWSDNLKRVETRNSRQILL